MTPSLSSSPGRVQAALAERGFALEVLELPQSTRTAADAASAIGCRVGQIAKSLVFKASLTGQPLMVVASGANRVDEWRIQELHGEGIIKADADFVRTHTGFVIGGVPPVGHLQPMAIYLDEDLLQYDWIWAAAGTPRAVFRLKPPDLVRMTGGRVSKIA
jgi:prolyl-tRNA editing enzyme YbaK/EbsC (Cys-tRNA(Pro) deacylase)